MTMSQLFNMFTRLIARRAMTWGINKGMSTLSQRKGQTPRTPRPDTRTRDLAKKMRVLSRLTRR